MGPAPGNVWLSREYWNAMGIATRFPGPALHLVRSTAKAPLWEGERICQENADGSLAVPSSKEELLRIKKYLMGQNLGGLWVGLGGHIPNVTDRRVVLLVIRSHGGVVLSKSVAVQLWADVVGVPADGWDGVIDVVKNGSINQHCVCAYAIPFGIGINDAECGRPLNAFLCYVHEPVRGRYPVLEVVSVPCPQPQGPPDQDLKLESTGGTNYTLGDNVTYICPCWKAWHPPSIPASPLRTSQCFGSLGWEYKLEGLRSCLRDPGIFCSPITLPPEGYREIKAIDVSKCRDLAGMYPPGSTTTYECGLKDFVFSSGDARVTWTCQDDGKWAPTNVSVTCLPRPNTTCESPGDADAIAFPDYHFVGAMVYCIHNDSIRRPIACTEGLTWYPAGFTPCVEVYPYFEVENEGFVLGKPKEGSLDGNFGAAAFCHQRFNAAGLPELRNRTKMGHVAQVVGAFVGDGFVPLPYNIL
ncbi:unnamed protein product [Darwinula stevensoni]|uniref:Uncharacterized protein n=1 Tax=Darwinula stevensoni TaxID=69355 RepID=A0A7R9A4W4_9CRUS|nr:unnamed protein product [Darwinula stevensoni]CAG0893342.1 unnamed protein product [Darwinula stevensoni]